MAAMSNYLENRLIDHLFRAQTLAAPATLYIGLTTSASGDTGPGTEVSGGNYSRVAVTSSLANWAGTQSAGSTVASSGTSGTTTNNAAITFPTPSADWGVVTGFAIYDAASAGNMLIYGSLGASKTINNGDAVQFNAGVLSFQIDN